MSMLLMLKMMLTMADDDYDEDGEDPNLPQEVFILFMLLIMEMVLIMRRPIE